MRRIAFAFLLVAFLPSLSIADEGYALQFDGIDDRIEFGDNYMLSNSSFTVEFWINTIQTSQGDIISKHICGYSNGWFINFNEPGYSGLAFYKGQDPRLLSNANIYDGLWHHIACVYNNTGEMYIYVDGLLSSSQTCPANMQSNATPLLIGDCLGDCCCQPYHFQGTLDELRIWNVAKSQTEIQSTMRLHLTGNEPGLIGYWDLDEGTGDIANDISQSHINGRLGNSDGPDSSDPTWVISTALLARTWHVSTTGNDDAGDGSDSYPFLTIQHGIDVSNDGDTVLVAPGIYIPSGPISMHNKTNLVIESQIGPDSTIIINQSWQSVFWVESCMNISIIGFSITNNVPNLGGGITNYRPLPNSFSNRIRECKIYGLENAIHIGEPLDNMYASISKNEIYMNGGISPKLNIYCHAKIDSNIIHDNSAAEGSAIHCSGGNVEIIDNQIYENLATNAPPSQGGGTIYIENEYYPSDSVTIENNSIYSNTAYWGGGIFCWGGICSIRHNRIYNNQAGNGSSGIYFYRSGAIAVVEYNDIFENVGYGIISDSCFILAEHNYWGSPSGPYNIDLNPEGFGNAVSSNVDFSPWSAVPINVENRPPSQVNLLSPENGASVNLETWITWTKSVDPDTFDIIKYNIQVDDDSLFSSPAIDNDTLSGDNTILDETVSFQLSSLGDSDSLNDNSRYSWRVRALDMFSDSSEWSEGPHYFYFNNLNDPPNPPISGFSPANFEEVISLRPVITWDDATDPDDPSDSLRYIIDIFAELPGAASGGIYYFFYDTTESGINQYQPPDTLFDNFLITYHVKTVDPHGLTSDWSEYQFFWTNHYNFPPEPFALINPPADAKQVEYYTRFSWDETYDYDPNSIITYSIEFSQDSLFNTIFWSLAGLTDFLLSVVTDSIPIIGNIYWRVKAIDEDGLIRIGGIPEGPRRLIILQPGDANSSGTTNGLDVTYLVSYLKGIGPAPDPILAGDANGSCQTNGLDVTYLISYLKGLGPAPIRPDCEPMILIKIKGPEKIR